MRHVLIVTLLLTVAGCSVGDSGGGGAIREDDLRTLVLQPGDLPRVFVRFDEGKQVMADSPGGSRADADRFGRKDGWKARYRRPGSSNTRGPLVIESRVDLFESSAGTEDELEAHEADLQDDASMGKPLDVPRLGDKAFGRSFVQGSGVARVRFYLVAWRDENVTASIFVNGFDGKLSLDEALALAEKVQRRIAETAQA